MPAHMELAWYLTCITPMGELSRMTQFKDKTALQKNIMTGLFTYPVLMAADILIYKANVVPVGDDQVQQVADVADVLQRPAALVLDVDDFVHLCTLRPSAGPAERE